MKSPCLKKSCWQGLTVSRRWKIVCLRCLRNHGVQVELSEINQRLSPNIECIAVNDANGECRAAVAWAKQKLAENPQSQLAIISPALGNIRRQLADLLDDTFHPETLHADHYEKPALL